VSGAVTVLSCVVRGWPVGPVLYGSGVTVQTAARAALDAAQSRAGVVVRSLTDLSELHDARHIFDAVWPSVAGGSQVQANLLRAIVHAGGHASAAYVGDRPVAAAFGFCGRHRGADGTWHDLLHSHMAAVLDEYRDRHIGSALKLHQRVWALEQSIPVITWSFDPLVRRNARLNVLKLGVEVRGYEVNFYGDMDDALNSGDPSDRVFAWWVVDSERAARAAGDGIEPLTDFEIESDDRRFVIELPDDIVALRSTDPDAARQWRLLVRDRLTSAFADGSVIIGIDSTGNYVLERHRP
jgi:predicted GNAT superfamily acetyltransferase